MEMCFFLVPDPFWSHLNSVLDKTEVISAELGMVRSSFPLVPPGGFGCAGTRVLSQGCFGLTAGTSALAVPAGAVLLWKAAVWCGAVCVLEERGFCVLE